MVSVVFASSGCGTNVLPGHLSPRAAALLDGKDDLFKLTRDDIRRHGFHLGGRTVREDHVFWNFESQTSLLFAPLSSTC